VTGSQVASNWRLRPLAALERSGPETGGDGLVLERLGLLRSAGAAGRDTFQDGQPLSVSGVIRRITGFRADDHT
jgi:hypothetical protein